MVVDKVVGYGGGKGGLGIGVAVGNISDMMHFDWEGGDGIHHLLAMDMVLQEVMQEVMEP